MNEILKLFTPNNIAGGSYERLASVTLINSLDAHKTVSLKREKIINDEHGNRLTTSIPLDELRVLLSDELLSQDINIINMLSGEYIKTMTVAEASQQIFNLLGSFRLHLAIQAEQERIMLENQQLQPPEPAA